MDIILTGLARSGTTLCCHLLNKLPGSVALLEPMDPAQLAGSSDRVFLKRVRQFYSQQRLNLWRNQTAISKANNAGVIPDNSFGSFLTLGGRRRCLAEVRHVNFKPLPDKKFRLIIKHPSMFTAKLGVLASRYPCYAIIRNPLALLLSWSSVDAHIADGHVPMAEIFDDRLRTMLSAEPDRISRQLIILSYFCDAYQRYLTPERILRYEGLIASGGRVLSTIDPSACRLEESFQQRNTNPMYERSNVEPLTERLLMDQGAWRSFYRDDDIVQLCRSWLAEPSSPSLAASSV